MKTVSTGLILLGLFLFIYPSCLTGQSSLRFNHLTSDQGLTSNITDCLAKDKLGFLWIGTNAGLNRFDGNNVKTYVHTPGDPHSLLHNKIFTLFADDRNHIWIGTAVGLSILRPETSSFINYEEIQVEDSIIDLSQGIMAIAQFADRIWIVTRKDILFTSKDSFRFERLKDPLLAPAKTSYFFFSQGILVTPTALWILSSKGPVYTVDGETFQSKYHNPDHWPVFDKGWLSAITNNGDSVIYFSTFAYPGIYSFQLANGKMDSFPFPPHLNPDGIQTISLCRSSSGEIWGSTISHGVFRINLSSRTSQLYAPDKLNPHSLSTHQTYQIMIDDQGTIFIATGRGLNYTNPIQPPFSILNIVSTELSSESLAVVEGEQGILWLATLHKGLFSLDTKTGRLDHFPLPEGYNEIWTLCPDGNNILLQTAGGLGTFSSTSKTFSPFPLHLPEHLQSLTTQPAVFFFKDKAGAYWIGYLYHGLLKFNPRTGEYVHFHVRDTLHPLPAPVLTAVDTDKENRLWLAFQSNDFASLDMTDHRVHHYTIPEGQGFEHIGSIKSIKRDDKNNVWIATSQAGLIQYQILSNTFTWYDTRMELSSNNLGSLEIDQQGHIWISTSNGLNRFDPVSKTFLLYNSSDGLSSNQFDSSPMKQTADGSIFFWSDDFITSFNPNDFPSNPNLPTLTFLSYSKSGTPYFISPTNEKLDFTYQDKIIQFEFIGLNFIDPSKNQYAYFLEGFDDTWTDAGNRPNATYSYLPAGDYTLRLKVTNKAGMWDVPEIAMKIHVTGPFWQTWWFTALCLAFSTLLIYAVYHYRLVQFKKIQAIRNKIAKDLHDEIGSTLGSISIYSAAAAQMKPDRYQDVLSALGLIGQNARTAMENMSDIVWAINPSNESLQNLLYRLHHFAIRLMEAKKIELEFNIPEALQHARLNIQQRKNIYLILREAIYNVAKYSQASTCSVTGYLAHKKINLEVRDDGVGFDNIVPGLGGNGLISMRQRAAELNGQIDITSGKNKGTCVLVQFSRS